MINIGIVEMIFDPSFQDSRQTGHVKARLEFGTEPEAGAMPARQGGVMPEQPSPKTWRHRLRISVRALIVLVLVLGGGLGWIVHRARVQGEAVAAIRRAGGSYYYDWQYTNRKSGPFARPRWPDWLVARIGDDYFGHVT